MENAKRTKKCDGQTKVCFTTENSIESYMKLGISMMLLYTGRGEKPRETANLISGKNTTIESRVTR